MKIALILPYFGKLPNYFDLYLLSASKNKDFHWLLFTDDKTPFDYPENFHVNYLSFKVFKEKMQEKFEFQLNIETAHKLCDFKPSYGYIFDEYLYEYDYWGFCDPDIIWGNISNFLDINLISKYDKISVLGHFSLIKNVKELNIMFMDLFNGELLYKKVYSKPIGFIFDERHTNSINNILEKNNKKILQLDNIADIDPYKKNFRLSIYDYNNDRYSLDSIKRQFFIWDNGVLYRFFKNKGKIIKEEAFYIHLQKRNMIKKFFNKNFNRFIIKPNIFLQINENEPKINYREHLRINFFDLQYFKVKYKNLKYKIKYSKYFYGI